MVKCYMCKHKIDFAPKLIMVRRVDGTILHAALHKWCGDMLVCDRFRRVAELDIGDVFKEPTDKCMVCGDKLTANSCKFSTRTSNGHTVEAKIHTDCADWIIKDTIRDCETDRMAERIIRRKRFFKATAIVEIIAIVVGVEIIIAASLMGWTR